mmetsp:Transcript_12357/g.24581  ORF Transcript_12357/g.24581 Transcript_12357/m.24581 type:complete len:300 (+) Transcript_12357:276-1175(+)
MHACCQPPVAAPHPAHSCGLWFGSIAPVLLPPTLPSPENRIPHQTRSRCPAAISAPHVSLLGGSIRQPLSSTTCLACPVLYPRQPDSRPRSHSLLVVTDGHRPHPCYRVRRWLNGLERPPNRRRDPCDFIFRILLLYLRRRVELGLLPRHWPPPPLPRPVARSVRREQPLLHMQPIILVRLSHSPRLVKVGRVGGEDVGGGRQELLRSSILGGVVNPRPSHCPRPRILFDLLVGRAALGVWFEDVNCNFPLPRSVVAGHDRFVLDVPEVYLLPGHRADALCRFRETRTGHHLVLNMQHF